MALATPPDERGPVDPVTGVATTAHSWDGIQELNNPLPRWWLWLFIATHVWALGYMVVYPAFPLINDATKGILNWHSRDALRTDLADLRAQRAGMVDRLGRASLQEIRTTPDLLAFAQAQGRAAFGDNCAPCHGQGAAGAKGYPNLNDDDWLWGGTLERIEHTIRHGARSTSDEGHQGAMPAFGRDGVLQRPQVLQVADYVRSLAGLPTEAGTDLAAGAKVYADNCAACHGEQGKGNPELGSPNLTDAIWLYGADRATIVDAIWNGRASVMPAWEGRLDDATIKALTVYVHSLGGGQ